MKTLDWAPDLAALATPQDPPGWQDFLLRWIEEESGGNPCALGIPGKETAIGQLYFDPQSQEQYGVRWAPLRAYCNGQACTRPLTSQERHDQASSLVFMAHDYFKRGQITLGRLSIDWCVPDQLCLAKLFHALPVLATSWIKAARFNGHAASFDDFYSWVCGMTKEQAQAVDTECGYRPHTGASPYFPLDRLVKNARKAGKGA